MKLSVTQYNRKIVIEDPDGDNMNLPNLYENMIRPLLLAMEFHPNEVDKLKFIEKIKITKNKMKCPHCKREVKELIKDYITGNYYCSECEEEYIDEQINEDRD